MINVARKIVDGFERDDVIEDGKDESEEGDDKEDCADESHCSAGRWYRNIFID